MRTEYKILVSTSITGYTTIIVSAVDIRKYKS